MDKLILQAGELFKDADFDWCVCGGFALDKFAGKQLRDHGDFDIMVFKQDKNRALQFMMDEGWTVYGRFMEEGRPIHNHIFYKIDDITNSYWDDCKNVWAVKPGCLPDVLYKLERLQAAQGDVYTYQTRKWLVENEIEFIEFEFDTKEGSDYIAKAEPRITRPLDKAILHHEGIAYLAPEITLFYKTDKFSSEHPQVKIKTESDFKAIVPLLPDESKAWLLDAIKTAYPDGADWLGWLDGLL